MAKKDVIKVEGKVDDLLPSTVFRVGLPHGHRTLAHNSSKIRQHFICTLPGDQIMIESSPYDLS
jgi:translation initiation factor IF-1